MGPSPACWRFSLSSRHMWFENNWSHSGFFEEQRESVEVSLNVAASCPHFFGIDISTSICYSFITQVILPKCINQGVCLLSMRAPFNFSSHRKSQTHIQDTVCLSIMAIVLVPFSTGRGNLDGWGSSSLQAAAAPFCIVVAWIRVGSDTAVP